MMYLSLVLVLVALFSNSIPKVSCKGLVARGHSLNASTSDRHLDPPWLCDCNPTILPKDLDNEEREPGEPASPYYPDPEEDVNGVFRRLADIKLGGSRKFSVKIEYPDGGRVERQNIISKPYPDLASFDRDQHIALALSNMADCGNVEMEAWTLNQAEADTMGGFQGQSHSSGNGIFH